MVAIRLMRSPRATHGAVQRLNLAHRARARQGQKQDNKLPFDQQLSLLPGEA